MPNSIAIGGRTSDFARKEWTFEVEPRHSSPSERTTTEFVPYALASLRRKWPGPGAAFICTT